MIKQLILSAIFLATFSVAANELDTEYTKLTFSEKVEKEVPQDSVRALLMFKAEGKTSTRVQNDVNKAVTRFAASVKSNADVELYTGRYSVQQRWNNRVEKYDGFTASQNLTLESKDKEALLKFVAKAQKDGFRVENLSYYLSKEAAKATHDELISKALKLVKHRAKLVSNQLARSSYHISEINVDYGAAHVQPPMHRGAVAMMATEAMAKSAAPVVEGTTESVSVRLNATVLLDVE